MTLTADTGTLTLQDLFDDNRLLFKNVDWSRTQAYALGLGNIYINLKGREAHGCVEPGPEYLNLMDRLKRELPQMVDPDTGDRPVYAVYTRDELYSGYDPELTPDLRVTNPPGYRVSWQTSLGGAPERLVESNDKAWSGDHCSLDPSFVPGIFLCNRQIGRAPHMLDLAPTILSLTGVKPPGVLEGRSLFEAVP
jgi:predicted AlkP superfamily phosphohydrolase/phosphomutase